MSILIIDNGGNQGSLHQKVLKEAGYKDCYLAHSSQEALAMLRLEYIREVQAVLGVEMMILDISGSENELETIRLIKSNYLYQDTPLAVISDNSTPQLMQMAFAFGATDFMVKPLDAVEMTVRVRAALRLQHEIDRRKAREKELVEVTKQLSDLNKWLSRLSLVDSLTTISNRRGFDHAYEQEWRRAVRGKSPISLIMIDIDEFKKYNDHFGHRAGDAALQRIGGYLKESLRRPGDVACRYGGEEFCVILSDTEIDGGLFVAERIRANIEAAEIDHPKSSVGKVLTASFGVASITPDMNDSPAHLVAEADRLLYRAKKQGRNCCLGAEVKSSADAAKKRKKAS